MFVIARSASKRPTLMHKLSTGSSSLTACGISTAGWSRAYFDKPIPQVMCLHCKGK